MKPSSKCRSRGAALVVVLSVTVFLALLVVSLAVALKLDRQASHYYAERSRADFFAREAIEAATAALHEGTAADRNWVSGPGRIISSTGKLSDADATNIALYSGSAAAGDTNAADINRRVLSDDEKELVTGRSGEPMRIAWIYVRKDGTRTLSAAADPLNPVVGRYAYWTDDESSRIDINTAWTKTGNTNSINHPSQVDLTAISGISVQDANAIRDKALVSPFHSPHDARRIDPALAGVLSSNRFDLTHNAYSTALNPWGQPKIILTTTTNNLPPEILARPDYTNCFLDIRANNADPGWYSGLKNTKVIYQLNRLAALIKTNAWPYSSHSLAQKYGGLNAAQIALDIMEYVRSAESTNAVITPLRTVYNDGSGFSFSGTTDPYATNVIVGSTRRPMISEIGLWLGPMMGTPSRPTRDAILKVEICLPKSYDISVDELAPAKFLPTIRYPVAGSTTNAKGFDGFGGDLIGNVEKVVDEAGDYRFVTLILRGRQEFNMSPAASEASRYTNRPAAVWARMVLDDENPAVDGSGMGSSFWESAPAAFAKTGVDYTNNNLIELPVDPEGVAPENITSVQVSDPRVNKYKANWPSGQNTFGKTNFQWRMNVSSTPPQDTDQNGEVTDASFILPERRGAASNSMGVVRSVSELGRIPTGVGANIPWRTLRMQPDTNSSYLPDWAIFDVLMAPYFPTNHSHLYTPKSNVVAGRINLNGRLTPFTNLGRVAPLQALFTGSTNMTRVEIEQIASNILERVPAANGGRFLGATNSYVSAGELTQIKGLSDQGEASERRLFGVADLAAVQSNVFRIYAIGQAVQQTPDGRLVVQAEKAVEAMLERSQTPGQPPSFQVVFWKTIPL